MGRLGKIGLIMLQGLDARGSSGHVSAQMDDYRTIHESLGCMDSDAFKKKQEAKYQELKANEERLHIETSSSMPSDEQLMFEAACSSNKGYVYDFGLQFTAITTEHWGGSSSLSSIPSVSSMVATMLASRRRRGYGDTCSRHKTSSPTS
ncbi:hypothetical protein M9H77_25547 [Catharanthus roseus]|uniref:Uncharacterized protein n=1 Tax=Catharanthus roseus TaxID=4058 RepID=A0ACC0A7F6_CATRO|nr:hypothetical protein M9H77_25547 [Catharanthus roseus]